MTSNNSCWSNSSSISLPASCDQAKNWTLDTLKSTPNRRFMKTHANLKDLPAGTAKGLKVSIMFALFARTKHGYLRRLLYTLEVETTILIAVKPPGSCELLRCP